MTPLQYETIKRVVSQHCTVLDLAQGRPLHIDARQGVAIVGSRGLRISPTHVRILVELQNAAPEYVPTKELMVAAHVTCRRSFYMGMARIRQNIPYLWHAIENEPNRGYRLVAQ